MKGTTYFGATTNIEGGAVGLSLGASADSADIQDFADHVLRKEKNRTSRYTSFSEELKVARKFTCVTDNRFVRKIALSELRALEAEGKIRIWDPDRIFEELNRGPRKLARRAADVRTAMKRNREVLIEGEIPADDLMQVE